MIIKTNIINFATRHLALGATIALMGVMSSNSAHSADLEYAFKKGGNEANRAAVRLLKRGNAADASRILQGIIAKGGRASLMKVAQTNLCAAHSMNGNQQAAMEACDAALGIDANYFEALINRGNVYYAQGQNAKALADFQAAEKTKPGKEIVERAIASLQGNLNSTTPSAGGQ